MIDMAEPTQLRNPLLDIALFNGLSDKTLQELWSITQIKQYNKHQTIIKEGEKPQGLQCLLKGEVKVSVTEGEGKELILKTLSAGDYFGELALIDDAPRTASIIATTQCETLILSKTNFERLRTSHPELNNTLLINLTKMVRTLTEQVKSLALKDVYGRIRTLLLQHCGTPHSDVQPSHTPQAHSSKDKLTQQGIASRVGSSREMVARIMKELTVGGYIQVEKKHIKLLKPLPEHY